MSAAPVPAGRERFARPLLIAFLAACAVDLAGVLTGPEALHLAAKPLLMPLLAGYAAARRGPRLLIAALLCGWAGDVFLLADSDAAFLVGMAGFAVGHVCYLVLFGRAPGGALPALGYALVLAVLVALLWSGLPGGLRVPVAGYSLLLTAMAYRSRVLGRYAAVGGALFLLSDALIAAGIADRPEPPAPGFWVMLTYVAAQLLLTLGALAPVHRRTASSASTTPAP
ncbi:lysoplasmalogenase [Streptomyces sp. NBC_00525]|uniref:lysoplasmalogenase n=1 Tax=Streptomyces sp. NBC_00525 TaxID=2903660 RepID=UPI002E82008D|nr:lysoplasmalogenase [Streptomyces sp. NBC_00525]WUC93012.1 lysoplasmalogenase [Streptomyces sp. NBC_00525]